MIYTPFQPHPALIPYIDAYWTVSGNNDARTTEKILPDGCVDIILNLGEDCKTDNGEMVMKHEQAYLVGTMTRFKETVMQPETKLLGIRFKPAAFSAFYTYASLHEFTNQTIEFEKVMSPDLKKVVQYSTAYLNFYFLQLLKSPRQSLLPVVEDIQNNKGQIDLVHLSKRHFITSRQLERYFKKDVGTTPKEFINIVRYQCAMKNLQLNHSKRSLLDLALDSGYYDHAHLTKEVKKYTGIAPSLV